MPYNEFWGERIVYVNKKSIFVISTTFALLRILQKIKCYFVIFVGKGTLVPHSHCIPQKAGLKSHFRFK